MKKVMPPVLLPPTARLFYIPGTALWSIILGSDLNPHGFHQWQENVRISSMMAPTIVLKDNKPEIVLGSGGSNQLEQRYYKLFPI